MPELRDRFAAAEHIPAPDLWDDIRWREISGPALRPERPSAGRRAVTILVAFAVFAAVVLAFGDAFRADVDRPTAPTPTASPHAPAPPPLQVSGELPATFPATLALPDGVRPVASRACCGYVQVWFTSELGSRDLEAFYRDALRRDGWSTSGQAASTGNDWLFYAAWDGSSASQQTAIVLGRPADASQLTYGSDAFDGTWDLYIIVYG
jgi:hypothetical protein